MKDVEKQGRCPLPEHREETEARRSEGSALAGTAGKGKVSAHVRAQLSRCLSSAFQSDRGHGGTTGPGTQGKSSNLSPSPFLICEIEFELVSLGILSFYLQKSGI